MGRKIARFQNQADGEEASFTADMCKGHLHEHGARIMSAYVQRLGAQAAPGGDAPTMPAHQTRPDL